MTQAYVKRTGGGAGAAKEERLLYSARHSPHHPTNQAGGCYAGRAGPARSRYEAAEAVCFGGAEGQAAHARPYDVVWSGKVSHLTSHVRTCD